MTTIGLIRHGITDWNECNRAQGWTDIPLNERGYSQAQAIAQRLSAEHWDIVFSSPLARARQTAEAIRKAIRINIIEHDDRLKEINCGLIEGTTEEDRLRQWGADWRSQDLGMEPYAEVAKRGITWINEISHIYANKRILVISHGAWIGLTLQHLLPAEYPSTHIDNASLTLLSQQHNQWRCTLYNCTDHFLESIN
ncbi:histidine phosphatase family protein [Paenibacillus sp. 1011MAR3C5]|uniref:histidine phosphatase family protein n=1 Tax=Paenibacillus sp. 1011MAR3C5 TaxID=1675787 RepID=UPI000E6C1C6A|nr:histidine phosphatase family protein [Paenibacillus sp. 1011MAR3C5]RJE89806.1 histidine phosphatase family protein [Paenibacillus sp. 1011MAR3C5]